MLSSIGDAFGASDASRGHPIRRHVPKDRDRGRTFPPHPPPSHPTATAEVGQLLDLGLALGHERFELVSLLGREEAGAVAAHAWADCGRGTSGRDPVSADARTRSRPRASYDDVRVQAEREELRREVEWLRERVDNLSRELVLARKDSGRLAKQLKQEERVGREQRRKADEATREAKSLRDELDRLKENRSSNGAASRAALADAHSRSVRMAERRRRQQAESLMQAYKGLYEDQLQTQHASAESYRSLTRGYSRLSADNKALRQETAAVAAFAAAARDAAGNAAALIASSVDLQRGTRASSPPPLSARSGEFSCDETTGPKKRDLRKEARVVDCSGGGGAGVSRATLPDSGRFASRAARSTDGALPGADGTGGSFAGLTVSAHASPATPAESAAAVAAAAEEVAAAAGALAQSATTASTVVDNGRSEEDSPAVTPASLSSTTGDRANGSSTKGRVAVEECSARGGTGASIASLAEPNRPYTAETLACSPFSENAADDSATIAGAPETATGTQTNRDASLVGDGALASDRAPVADCFIAPRGAAPTKGACVLPGDGESRGRGAVAGESKGYAFPPTVGGEEGQSFLTEDPSSSAAAPSATRGKNDIVNKKNDVEDGASDDRRKSTDGKSSEKRSETDARPAAGAVTAIPPENPAPRWRGRSAGPGRLLASSASWAEAVEVDAPKRSTSPTGPRRGRWGDCGRAGGGAWGGKEGAAGEDGCIRIEPSCRARPHSI